MQTQWNETEVSLVDFIKPLNIKSERTQLEELVLLVCT